MLVETGNSYAGRQGTGMLVEIWNRYAGRQGTGMLVETGNRYAGGDREQVCWWRFVRVKVTN